jgi:hypothetical protein
MIYRVRLWLANRLLDLAARLSCLGRSGPRKINCEGCA